MISRFIREQTKEYIEVTVKNCYKTQNEFDMILVNETPPTK